MVAEVGEGWSSRDPGQILQSHNPGIAASNPGITIFNKKLSIKCL